MKNGQMGYKIKEKGAKDKSQETVPLKGKPCETILMGEKTGYRGPETKKGENLLTHSL